MERRGLPTPPSSPVVAASTVAYSGIQDTIRMVRPVNSYIPTAFLCLHVQYLICMAVLLIRMGLITATRRWLTCWSEREGQCCHVPLNSKLILPTHPYHSLIWSDLSHLSIIHLCTVIIAVESGRVIGWSLYIVFICNNWN
jgi:hypothetical protein